MDRKEAIEILKDERRVYFIEGHERKLDRALDMAIEALEREIEYGQMVVDFTKGETMTSDEWRVDNE